MDKDRDEDTSPNPPFIEPNYEHPEAERTRLYRQHRAAGTLGTYFDLYPLDRPPGHDRANENER
jgi:hypothetical protein